MQEISKNISENLKALRKHRQLTLEELAEKSSVSKSMLGEIERGKTNPTITVLWKIAQALKTPLTTLIGSQTDSYIVVRKTDRVPLDQAPSHVISSVFPYYEPHRLEVLALELPPGEKLNNTGHMKGVEEYLFILDGTVKVTVQNERILLHSQDSIRFAADISHTIENASDKQAKMLNIIHYM